MYDIPFFTPTRKEMAVAILGVFIFLVAVFSAGYMLGVRNVHDNGSGVAGVGNEIGHAESNISNAATGIEAAQGHADQVANGIESAKEQAGYIHSTATTSAGIVSECQSILAGIRSRGKTKEPAH